MLSQTLNVPSLRHFHRMHDVTLILSALEQGDPSAADELLPLVYEELRQLAAAHLRREASGQTLQATALVHEAYLRLVGDNDGHWDSRRHFFAAAALAMRRILVENARRRRRLKHGGGFSRQELDDLPAEEGESQIDLLSLDESLSRLAENHPQAAELVQLRYFAGLTMTKAAQTLGVPERSAARLWTYAKAWLLREMGENREKN